MKKILILLVVFLLSFGIVFSYADESDNNGINLNAEYEPLEVGYFYRYDEENVRSVTGTGERASSTIKTGSAGGSISVIYSIVKSSSFSGSIDFENFIKDIIKIGVSFEINDTKSTELGYQLNVGPNKTAYIKATPVYNVSEGVLRKYHGQRLVSSHRVKYKSPSYFIYELIEY